MHAPLVSGVDHLVLNVADVDRSLAFYQAELGLAPVRVEEWRRGEAPFPSVRVSDTMIIDLFPGGGEGAAAGGSEVGSADPGGAEPEDANRRPATRPNLNHFCLVVQPTDLAELAASGRFKVLDGPGPRYGAQGDGMSLYVEDPDGNTVELRYYAS